MAPDESTMPRVRPWRGRPQRKRALILMDLSFRPIAIDRGATSILAALSHERQFPGPRQSRSYGSGFPGHSGVNAACRTRWSRVDEVALLCRRVCLHRSHLPDRTKREPRKVDGVPPETRPSRKRSPGAGGLPISSDGSRAGSVKGYCHGTHQQRTGPAHEYCPDHGGRPSFRLVMVKMGVARRTGVLRSCWNTSDAGSGALNPLNSSNFERYGRAFRLVARFRASWENDTIRDVTMRRAGKLTDVPRIRLGFSSGGNVRAASRISPPLPQTNTLTMANILEGIHSPRAGKETLPFPELEQLAAEIRDG